MDLVGLCEQNASPAFDSPDCEQLMKGNESEAIPVGYQALLHHSELAGRIAVTFDYVYVVSNSFRGGVIIEAFEPAQGQRVFAATVGTGRLTGDIGIAADVLYMGQDCGCIHAVAAHTGELLHSVKLGGNRVSALAIAMGRVYVANAVSVFALGLDLD